MIFYIYTCVYIHIYIYTCIYILIIYARLLCLYPTKTCGWGRELRVSLAYRLTLVMKLSPVYGRPYRKFCRHQHAMTRIRITMVVERKRQWHGKQLLVVVEFWTTVARSKAVSLVWPRIRTVMPEGFVVSFAVVNSKRNAAARPPQCTHGTATQRTVADVWYLLSLVRAEARSAKTK